MAAAKPALKQVSPPLTIGQLIDNLAKADADCKAATAAETAAKAVKTDLEAQIFAALDAQKTLSGSSKTKRVSISTSEEPQTTDWEAFIAWAAKTKNLHLVQRRVSAPAWREILALKKNLVKVVHEVDGKKVERMEVPGLAIFEKRKLSFTTIAAK